MLAVLEDEEMGGGLCDGGDGEWQGPGCQEGERP